MFKIIFHKLKTKEGVKDLISFVSDRGMKLLLFWHVDQLQWQWGTLSCNYLTGNKIQLLRQDG